MGRTVPDPSLPTTYYPITAIDLDMTNDCPLRCDYCFKGPKSRRALTFEIGSRAIDWLIGASLDVRDVKVFLMGGEPLMAFDLIRELVPYGKRRAALFGKTMHFSATTNMVLMNNDILTFWRRYDMGFHTSVDGVPEAQDAHRHFPNGRGSSDIIEEKIPMFLAHQPSVAARATFCTDTVHLLSENARYFDALGYTNMVFAASMDPPWLKSDIAALEREVIRLADFLIEKMRRGEGRDISPLSSIIRYHAQGGPRREHVCGAGRGFVLIDTEGNIWPCHRFGGDAKDRQWIMGSIFGEFRSDMQEAFLSFSCTRDLEGECEHCPAAQVCPGQCLAEAQQHSGSIYRPVPAYCAMTRVFFEQAMRALHTLEAEGNELFLSSHCSPSQHTTSRETHAPAAHAPHLLARRAHQLGRAPDCCTR